VATTLIVPIKAEYVISCKTAGGTFLADASGKVNTTYPITIALGSNKFYPSCLGLNGQEVVKEFEVKGVLPAKATLTLMSPSPVFYGETVTINQVCTDGVTAIRSWTPSTALVNGPEVVTLTTFGLNALQYICVGEANADTAMVAVTVIPLPAGFRVGYDRPDQLTGRQIKVVYMTSKDGIDRSLDTNGVLEATIQASLTWFVDRTDKTVQVDTYDGKLDIMYFRSRNTNVENEAFGTGLTWYLAQELHDSRLFSRRDSVFTKYIIFYEGKTNTPVNGVAVISSSAGVLYLTTCNGTCFLHESGELSLWAFGWLHEFFHTLRYVDPLAPNHDSVNPRHTTDSCLDLMYGGNGACGGWTPSKIDPDQDDWYGDSVPAGVRNAKLDPWLIPAPFSLMMAAPAINKGRQKMMPIHFNELVLP